MPEGGFLEARRASPTSLAIVVLIHGAAISALALSKMEMPPIIDYGPIDVTNIPIVPEPPPVPPEPKAKELPDQRVTYRDPVVRLPVDDSSNLDAEVTLDPPRFDPIPTPDSGEALPQPRPVPMPEPVRIEAQVDPRSELQPPYPASEERAGNEGIVKVRVTIGADGRVKAVERVSAASDAFYRATERHALRHWRFRPATVDGRPVESRKTMTVEFRLTG